MRAACSEPGQAQSTHVHEHGNTVPPELADGDELDPIDAFAVVRRRIGLAIRVTRHNHPMPSGGLVWEVIKGSIDLSRAEAVAGFFFQLPAAGLQRRLVSSIPPQGNTSRVRSAAFLYCRIKTTLRFQIGT